MPLKSNINKANGAPGMSKNKWNSMMLMEIGANKIKAKAPHFFNKSCIPIITSKKPTTGKM